MSDELTAVLCAVGALIAWSAVCVEAGRRFENWLKRRSDLNERDAWAERYQQDEMRKSA